MDIYDFSHLDERPKQAANVAAVMHVATSTPTSSRPTPRPKSTPRVRRITAVPMTKTAPSKITLKDLLLPSETEESTTTATKKRPAAPTNRAAKRTKSNHRQRYVVEAIVGLRRANDWTDNNHTYQYAIKWTGYEKVTWNTPEVLDNYPLVLRLLTDALEKSSDGKVPVYAPQSPDEVEGAELA